MGRDKGKGKGWRIFIVKITKLVIALEIFQVVVAEVVEEEECL
jgi:hypothetical protein